MRLFGRRDTGPRAVYAAILDGRHLWLALDGGGTAELEGQGHRIALGEVTDLLEVLPIGANRPPFFDAVKDGAPVSWAPPAAMSRRVPSSPDGRVQLWLEAADGFLRVGARPSVPTAELDATDLRGDGIHLRLRPAAGVAPGVHLLLLDTDDRVRSTLPVTAHDGLLEALVGADDLPAGFFGVLRVAVGTEDAWVRVRRRANDLADPNHAVLLPELHVGDHPRARLRWNPDGLLALRSLDPDEAP